MLILGAWWIKHESERIGPELTCPGGVVAGPGHWMCEGSSAVVQVGRWWVKCLDDRSVCFQSRSVIYLIFWLSFRYLSYTKAKDRTWTYVSRGVGAGPGHWKCEGSSTVVQGGGWWVKCLDDRSVCFQSRSVIYLIFWLSFRYPSSMKAKDRTWTYVSRGVVAGPGHWICEGSSTVVQGGGWWVKCLDDWSVCFQSRSVSYI